MLRFLTTVLLLLLVAAMVAAAVRPVCVALTPTQLKQLHPRFDDRDDHDMLFLKVYQRRDDVPYECKTWLTREVLQ